MKNYFLTLLLAAIIFVPFTTNAQVTIGSGEAPSSFSVLELISDQAGLRLPQMTRSERNAMVLTAEFQAERTGKAVGLMIYNTSIRCVETWNGERWTRSRNCPCGAYTVKSDDDNTVVWRQFMCHNLGADTSLDPFTPHAGLHGAMFKWGTGIAALTARENNMLITRAQIEATGYTWAQRGGGTPPTCLDNWNMTTANPCPPGFRVPTAAEWQGVIDNNPLRSVGTIFDWVTINQPSPQGNFSTGTFFGDALFLPATGNRGPPHGQLNNRGRIGFYWSSSANSTPSMSSELVLLFHGAGINTSNANNIRSEGMQVRCIAD